MRSKRKKCFSLFFIIFLSFASIKTAYAENFTGMSFLKIPVGAAPSGMGGAFTAAGKGAWSVFYNPAGIANGIDNEVVFSHLEYYQQMRSEDLAALFKLNEDVRMAAGLRYFYAPDTPRTLAAENMAGFSLNGSFIFSDLAASLSLGFRLSSGLSFGLTGKVIVETIDTASATAVAFDTGILFAKPEWADLHLAAALNGLSLPYTFLTAKESIPLVLKTGASALVLPIISLIAAADMDIPRDGDIVLHAGFETFLNGFLKLRVGYFSSLNLPLSGTITAGTGIVKGKFSIDYGLGIPNGRTLDHRIAAGLRF